MKNYYLIGNWKMNQDLKKIKLFFDQLGDIEQKPNTKIWIAPQFIHISKLIKLNKVPIGAQNCSWEDRGAFTGEISAKSLKELGVKFVIIGHSERREIFKESENLNKKVINAISNNLKVIFCVGENLPQRKNNKTQSIIENQIVSGLKNIKDYKNIIIAYEPVWAIGTGKTATPSQAQEIHQFIRIIIAKKLKWDSISIPIVYGGSINPNNFKELLKMKDIDGGLVGGASLEGNIFKQLVKIINFR